jgi:hypothetical protein
MSGPRARVRAASIPADAVALGALSVLGIGLAALTWGTWGDPGRDTGYDLVAASRVAHGELPYVDFPYYYGPLAPMLLSLAVRVGGGGLSPAIVVGLLSVVAIVALTYALARTFVQPLGAFLAAAITLAVAVAPTNFSYVLPHTSAMTFGMAGLLGALVALSRRRSLVAGVCLGLVALTKPELEAAAVAAAAAWCMSQRTPRRELLQIAIPALALPGAVYGAILTRVSLHALVAENLYPSSVLRAGGDKLLRLHAPLTLSSLAHHAERVALYGLGVLLLVALGRGLSHASRRVIVPLAVLALVTAAVALADLEATRTVLQLVYGWIPGGAAIAVVVLAIRSPRSSDALALSTALAIAGGTTYAAFYVLSSRAQTAVYFVPLAAVFLVALHLRALPHTRVGDRLGLAWLAFLAVSAVLLVLNDAGSETVRLAAAGGAIKVAPADAQAYSGALAAVDRLTRPGEPVLFAPQLSIMYPLSGHPAPLPQISLLPGALPNAQAEQQAITRLEAAHVRVVVTDTHPFTEYGHGAFGTSFDRGLATWITRNFNRAGTYPGQAHTLVVWRRSSS